MRQKHIKVLKERLKNGEFSWLVRQAWNLAAVPTGQKIGKPLNKPIFGGLVITYRCNETCPMCNVYKLGDKELEMNTEEWLDIVDQYAEMKVAGISITGGEPMVYGGLDDVIRRCKQHGIPVSISTNGLLLRKKDRAKKLLETGIDSIAISVDGATPAEHDESRGKKGAFELTIEGIQALLAARKELGKEKSVFITMATVINNHNFRNFEDLLKLAQEMGVDNVSLNPVHNTYVHFDEGRPDDLLFDKKDNQAHVIPEFLREMKKKYGILDSSNGYIDLLDDFFQGNPLPIPCRAPYFSLYIDCFRDILPCGGYFYETRKVANLGDQRLPDLWKSGEYQKVRDELKNCRSCYYSCMAELNLPYAKLP